MKISPFAVTDPFGALHIVSGRCIEPRRVVSANRFVYVEPEAMRGIPPHAELAGVFELVTGLPVLPWQTALQALAGDDEAGRDDVYRDKPTDGPRTEEEALAALTPDVLAAVPALVAENPHVNDRALLPPEGAALEDWLDPFTRAYLEEALDSGPNSPDREHNGFPEYPEPVYDLQHIDAESLALAVAECRRFQRTYAAELAGIDGAPIPGTARSAADLGGYLFYHTRRGSGVGFSDHPEVYGEEAAETLHEACGWRTPYPETDLYLGDDGALHFTFT